MNQNNKKSKKVRSFQDLGKLFNGDKSPNKEKLERPKFMRGESFHPNQGAQQKRSETKKELTRGLKERFSREKGDKGRQNGPRNSGKYGGTKFPLPKEVTEGIYWKQCENFSLLFYRFLPDVSDGSINKKEILETLVNCGNRNWKERPEVQYFLDRQYEFAKSLQELYGKENFCELEGKTVSRLVVGLGNRNALETGMTLDRLYGIPYLPATAQKGICRAWASSQETEPNNLILDAFGSQKQQGKIEFYDAYPVRDYKGSLFEVEIINVHYQPYYSDPKKEKPPADYYNPVPNYFLIIPEGVPFHIFLSSKESNRILLEKVSNWLKDALSEFGIGAKTSVGYGEMDVSKKGRI